MTGGIYDGAFLEAIDGPRLQYVNICLLGDKTLQAQRP
jgi:hypothetical protein